MNKIKEDSKFMGFALKLHTSSPNQEAPCRKEKPRRAWLLAQWWTSSLRRWESDMLMQLYLVKESLVEI